MNDLEVQKLLAEHLAPFRALPYAELASQVGSVIAFQAKGPSGVEYNVEIMLVWDSPGTKTNVRVIAAVDDHRWPAWFRPATRDFIVAPDGSFVGENESPSRWLPRYFRREIADPRADEFDAWGTCETFFELDEDGRCLRQIERYQNGFVLKYDATHRQDEYGALSEPADDLTDFGEFEISAAEFEDAWRQAALNRR